MSRGKETQLDIELHFEKQDELPASKRIDPAVRIVKMKEKGEFLVERDSDDRNLVRVTAGGLALTLDLHDFLNGVCCMVEEELGLQGGTDE